MEASLYMVDVPFTELQVNLIVVGVVAVLVALLTFMWFSAKEPDETGEGD